MLDSVYNSKVLCNAGNNYLMKCIYGGTIKLDEKRQMR